jgi:hypothetical membrane protein
VDLARPVAASQWSEGARRRTAGVALFALAGGFLTMIMLAASLVPGYDMATAAISDLGVIPETAMLFNVTLVLVGVLNIVAAVLLFGPGGRGRHPVLLAVFVAAGAGAIGAGVFPLDTGAPHSLSALVAFLAFNLQAIGAASYVRGPMRAVSVLAGAAGLVFVVLMILGDGGNAAAFGPIGHGGTERMIVYPAMLWMLAFGGYFMAEGDPASA